MLYIRIERADDVNKLYLEFLWAFDNVIKKIVQRPRAYVEILSRRKFWRALKSTVAHICKHNKQFLKHNKILLEHNKHFSKHNTVLSKHNKSLSKRNTVLLKHNAIFPKHNTIFAKHKKDLILLLRSAEFVTIQSLMNLTFMDRYWKLPHFFVIRVTICRVRMSRYWALSGTVAHICKHNKQFLKHNMIFLEHNKHFSKHNMVLSKHNKRLSKHDTVLLKDNTIIPWLWLAMIRSLCGRLKSLLLYFGDFDIRF